MMWIHTGNGWWGIPDVLGGVILGNRAAEYFYSDS